MFLGDRAVTPSCYALASHSRSANARKYCMTGRRHNVGSLHGELKMTYSLNQNLKKKPSRLESIYIYIYMTAY